MTDPDMLWSVADAVELLDPPMTRRQIRALITLADIRPVGTRSAGRLGGRPAYVYDAHAIQRAHRAAAPMLVGD